MGKQLPANVDVSAPKLLIGGKEVDKFMGLTGFTYENPSDLLETFEGTVVGVESNNDTNKVSLSFAVHNESADMDLVEAIIKKGLVVQVEVVVPTEKLANYRTGQIVRRGITAALVKGGGTALGGKNAGAVVFTATGSGPIVAKKNAAGGMSDVVDATVLNGILIANLA